MTNAQTAGRKLHGCWAGVVAMGVALAIAALTGCAGTSGSGRSSHAGLAGSGSVIFLHPDGTGANLWGATRLVTVGPDGDLEWDKLPVLGLYRGHLSDALAASSNAGGTIHAYGMKVRAESFGNDNGQPLLRDGQPARSIAQEALARGKAVGIVSSATVADAGTGTFLASVPSRREYAAIAAQMLDQRPHVLLGGGERYFLPRGVQGRHGEGARTDGRDLIAEARAAGYEVVFTRDELKALPAGTRRVLGLFASNDTFLDMPEEQQRKRGTPDYVPTAPTYGEMVDVALRVLSMYENGFLLVAEEEGTDNFAGKNNARGTFVAAQRADAGIGVARRFLARNPGALLMVAADSDCGGMQVVSEPEMDPNAPLPARDEDNGAPWDGREGTGTLPFLALPDRTGKRIPFAIAWASEGDVAGAVLVRADGARASELITPTMDNTRIYEVIRAGLFGR